MTKSSTEYVLTTSATENARLKRQHDLWLEDTRSVWRRARMSREQSILEIGAGPGYTTLDLARYLGHSCKLTTIELSPNYAQECAERLKEYPNVRVINGDLHEVDLGQDRYDAIYGRWIWMFLPKLEQAFEKILASLKPGGVFILQEYVNYQAMGLSPNVPIQDTVVEAIMKSIRDTGGEPDVVKQLIPLLEKNGLEIEVLEPIGRLIRPSEPFWDWPTQFYQTYLPTLQSKGYLSAEEVQSFEKAWKNAEKAPGSFWISPTVANVIARKK